MTSAASHDPRYRANDDVLFQDLDGEGVLLNLNTGVYFGLDRVGTRVWQLLETHARASEIIEQIVSEFDVTAERCTADVRDLAKNMAEHGLITIE